MRVETLFSYRLTALSAYVDREHLAALKLTFKKHLEHNAEGLAGNLIEELVFFLFDQIDQDLKEANRVTVMIQDLSKQLSYTASEREKQKIILDYAYRFNASKKELEQDEEALQRWFDEDALAERIRSRVSFLQRRVMVAMDRIGSSIELLQQEHGLSTRHWKVFDLNRHFLELIQYRQEDVLTKKIFMVLIDLARMFEIGKHPELLDEKLFRFIYKVSLSSKENVWIQNSAIEFLCDTDMTSFISIAKARASAYRDDDSIFIRHKIAALVCRSVDEIPELMTLLKEEILGDPSPYVRQGVTKALKVIKSAELEGIARRLIMEDTQRSVRASGVLQVLETFACPGQQIMIRSMLWEAMETEKDSFVRKTVLYVIRELSGRYAREEGEGTGFVQDSFDRLASFIQEEKDLILKRYAAMVREYLWICMDKERYAEFVRLRDFVGKIQPGKGKRVPEVLASIESPRLHRMLSVIAQDDFSLELQQVFFGRTILYRGDRFGRRIWRLVYEFFNPSPDKRQAFLHTIGRIYEGNRHFPSAILAEQAPTKVPGEPYFIPEEESWRPYLPLPDHFISALRQPTLKLKSYEIYSSEGCTTLSPPSTFIGRIRAELFLSWHFAKIARMRNWKSDFKEPPSAYIAVMQRLGFEVTFKPYVPGDKSVMRYFPLSFSFSYEELQRSVGNYFVSAYENSLSDLLMFLVVVFAIFFLRHLNLSRKIKRARNNIPLSIGGWGTRGKSGTERLKAALFNSLGLRVFSKTTGNEAMFLHADSFETMREMYLFRPYDKATIWEQADVVMLADRLGIDVFLWESMGLTPAYVEILQQQWMRDDIATITNTYPDHEDLQGPAGINIPQVMTRFIPERSILVSSEEIMYPILREHAKKVGTSSHQVGWLKAGLLPPDILERFPYEEHPFNIALVLRMAQELEIDEDEALKAMADNIVPDLGVLKTYPEAVIDQRSLSFINGMSANERFGALGNWRRMGLDRIDDIEEPGTFITTVINNRADRVSRSRVFASMMIEDIAADCHVLIGSNLSGFENYLEESWKSFSAKLSLQASEEGSAQEIVMQYAKRFRIMRSTDQLRVRLDIMLGAMDVATEKRERAVASYFDLSALEELLSDIPDVMRFYRRDKQEYDELQALLKMLPTQSKATTYDEVFKEQLWKWFKRRVVVIEDFHASGDEIIRLIAHHTPFGMHNRIIGMQNIKGTGLDFVYRWVAWGKCYEYCQEIQSGDSNMIRQGVEKLAAFDEHGPLTFALVKATVEIAKSSVATQSEYYQAQIQIIEGRLKISTDNLAEMDIQQKRTKTSSRYLSKAVEILESFLDAGDAVKRRKKANRIYADLIAHRISHKRAAQELQEITKRQKGGWLSKRFHL